MTIDESPHPVIKQVSETTSAANPLGADDGKAGHSARPVLRPSGARSSTTTASPANVGLAIVLVGLALATLLIVFLRDL